MTAGFDPGPSVRGVAKGLSLAIAGTVSLLLLVDPYVISDIPAWSIHAGLPLMMSGASGLFMHGLGFEVKNAMLRFVFHPLCAWLLFMAGLLVIIASA